MKDIQDGLLGKYYVVLFYWAPTGRNDRPLEASDEQEREEAVTEALRKHGVQRKNVRVVFSRVDTRFNAPDNIPYSLLKRYEVEKVHFKGIFRRLGKADGGDVSDFAEAKMPHELLGDTLRHIDVSSSRFDRYLKSKDERGLFAERRWRKGAADAQIDRDEELKRAKSRENGGRWDEASSATREPSLASSAVTSTTRSMATTRAMAPLIMLSSTDIASSYCGLEVPDSVIADNTSSSRSNPTSGNSAQETASGEGGRPPRNRHRSSFRRPQSPHARH